MARIFNLFKVNTLIKPVKSVGHLIQGFVKTFIEEDRIVHIQNVLFSRNVKIIPPLKGRSSLMAKYLITYLL